MEITGENTHHFKVGDLVKSLILATEVTEVSEKGFYF